MATPESKVKDKVKKMLSAYGDRVYWFMPPGNGYGRMGIPDFVCCANGWFFSIEAKAEDGKVTPWQGREMDKIDKAGGTPFVVRNDVEIKRVEGWILSALIER